MESGTIFRGGWVLVAALALSAGCSKKESAASQSGSAGSGAAAESKASGKAKTTLQAKDVRAAYESEVNDRKKMNDPMDKKVAAFVAKVSNRKGEAGKRPSTRSTATCARMRSSSGVLNEQASTRPVRALSLGGEAPLRRGRTANRARVLSAVPRYVDRARREPPRSLLRLSSTSSSGRRASDSCQRLHCASAQPIARNQ
jgi:hypothetical protein